MSQPETDEQPDSADEVIRYLRAHPDFFVAHKGLLAELDLPHATGRAVSLVERQVGILRERNVDMRRRMNELVQTARANDDLFSKTRSLTLALLDARNLQELNEVLATFVLVDFEADFVCCHLTGTRPLLVTPSLDHIRSHEDAIPFHSLLAGQSPTCLPLRGEELERIFPMSRQEVRREADRGVVRNPDPDGADETPASTARDAAPDDGGSAVLLPLELNTGDGVLAIGSRDTARFSNDMDTLFVSYIADVLGKVLDRLI